MEYAEGGSDSPGMITEYRTEVIDCDARRDPKTERYCVACKRDIKPGAKAREVHLVDGGLFALHPDDESKYPADDTGDLGMHLLGMKCARVLGLEWSVPEVHQVPGSDVVADGDVECTVCARRYFSGEGPGLDIVVCPDCWTGGSCGPLGVVE